MLRLLKSDGPLVGALAFVAFVGLASSVWLAQFIENPSGKESLAYATSSQPHETFWERMFSDPVGFFTFTLTVVTGLLAYLAFRTDKTAQKSAVAAHKAADAALLSATRAHEEFVATHRPHLRVRFVRLESAPPNPVRIGFVVYNVGETRAIITDSQIDLQFHDNIRLPPPPLVGDNLIGAIELEPADHFGTSIERPNITFALIDDMEDGGHGLYLVGSIKYRDANNTRRQMGFCRRYVPEFERFDPVSDPDYEYED